MRSRWRSDGPASRCTGPPMAGRSTARSTGTTAAATVAATASRPAARMEHIPVLKVEGCLLVSIQVDMHDQLAMALQDDLTRKVVETRARGVMIDISSLEIVDSFIGRMLNNIAAMAKVL